MSKPDPRKLFEEMRLFDFDFDRFQQASDDLKAYVWGFLKDKGVRRAEKAVPTVAVHSDTAFISVRLGDYEAVREIPRPGVDSDDADVGLTIESLDECIQEVEVHSRIEGSSRLLYWLTRDYLVEKGVPGVAEGFTLNLQKIEDLQKVGDGLYKLTMALREEKVTAEVQVPSDGEEHREALVKHLVEEVKTCADDLASR